MEEHLFLVGSEDGRIYKCSKAYTSQFLQVYQVGGDMKECHACFFHSSNSILLTCVDFIHKL